MNEHRRYLLGAMDESEREAFRERLLADAELFAEVEAEELEILDAYSRGEASAAERQAVERQLLRSPLQRRRLLLSRALASHRRSVGWRYAAIGIAALLCLGVFSFWRSKNTATLAPAPTLLVSVLELPPPASRSAAAIPRLKVLPAGALELELRMPLTPAFGSGALDLSLRDAGGREVARGGLVRLERYLSFRVKRALVPPGAYEAAFLEQGSAAPVAFSYFVLE